MPSRLLGTALIWYLELRIVHGQTFYYLSSPPKPIKISYRVRRPLERSVIVTIRSKTNSSRVRSNRAMVTLVQTLVALRYTSVHRQLPYMSVLTLLRWLAHCPFWCPDVCSASSVVSSICERTRLVLTRPVVVMDALMGKLKCSQSCGRCNGIVAAMKPSTHRMSRQGHVSSDVVCGNHRSLPRSHVSGCHHREAGRHPGPDPGSRHLRVDQ